VIASEAAMTRRNLVPPALLAIVLVAALLPATANAELVVINFDDTPQPCEFGKTTALRDAYLPLGVSFSGPGALDGGAVLDSCGNIGQWTGYSAPNFVAFSVGGELRDSGWAVGPELLTFTGDVTSVRVSVTGDGDQAVLEVYDAAMQLLGRSSAWGEYALEVLSVAAPGIRYARVYDQGAATWVFDDLAFEIDTTPAACPTWGRLKTIYR
jgi:hypothetical protein